MPSSRLWPEQSDSPSAPVYKKSAREENKRRDREAIRRWLSSPSSKMFGFINELTREAKKPPKEVYTSWGIRLSIFM